MHPDQEHFQCLVKDLGLVALNTWPHFWIPTFIGHGSSRIDFVLARRQQITCALAHRTQTITNFPVGAWRDGACHRPIVAELPKHRLHTLVKMQQPQREPSCFPLRIREAMRSAALANTQQWQLFVQTIDSDVHRQPLQSLEELNQRLCHAVRGVFDTASNKQNAGNNRAVCHEHANEMLRTPTWHDPQLQGFARNMWLAYSTLKSVRQVSVGACFAALKHFCTFSKFQKQHKIEMRKCKQRKVHEFLRHASHLHTDAHLWYKHVRSLCPKQRRARICLRDEGGAMQSPAQELASLHAYFHKLWQADVADTAEARPLHHIPFTEDDLREAIAKMPTTKAVAPGYAPPLAWKCASALTAQLTMKELHQHWLHKPCLIPDRWRASWLTLLPKPGKPATQPANLRPISLLDPLGKLVSGSCAKQLGAAMASTFQSSPCFAYLASRSVDDCVLRAMNHCRQVRKLCAQNKTNVHARYEGHTLQPLAGGFQVSFDLTKAFDNVDRTILLDCIQACDASTDLKSVLQAWIRANPVHVIHKGMTSTFDASRGIRQGSKEAPRLWNLLMLRLVQNIERKLGSEWVRACLSIYADDIHCAWTCASPQEFHTAVNALRVLIAEIDALGLNINPQKSSLSFRFTGAWMSKLMKHYVLKTPEGTFFRLHSLGGNDIRLPLVKQHVYLGTVLSYFSVEKLTVDYRVKCAKHAFSQLRRWLLANHMLSVQSRMRLYFTCVWTTLTYGNGVHAVGLLPSGVHKITTLAMTHIRQICKDHPYVTRHTHAFVLTKYNIESPYKRLLREHGQKQARHQTRRFAAPVQDMIKHVPPYPDFPHLQEDPAMQPGLASEEVPMEAVLCPHCDQLLMSTAALKLHVKKIHAAPEEPPQTYIEARDSRSGLPWCSHCDKKFFDFRNLRQHIAQRACPSFSPNKALTHFALLQDDVFKGKVIQTQLKVISMPEYMSKLQHHCVLCGHWSKSSAGVAGHLKTHHPHQFKAAGSLIDKLHSKVFPYKSELVCPYCSKKVKNIHQHRCPVILHFAIAKVHLGDTEDRPVKPQTKITSFWRCKNCKPCAPPSAEAFHPNASMQDSAPVAVFALDVCDDNENWEQSFADLSVCPKSVVSCLRLCSAPRQFAEDAMWAHHRCLLIAGHFFRPGRRDFIICATITCHEPFHNLPYATLWDPECAHQFLDMLALMTRTDPCNWLAHFIFHVCWVHDRAFAHSHTTPPLVQWQPLSHELAQRSRSHSGRHVRHADARYVRTPSHPRSRDHPAQACSPRISGDIQETSSPPGAGLRSCRQGIAWAIDAISPSARRSPQDHGPGHLLHAVYAKQPKRQFPSNHGPSSCEMAQRMQRQGGNMLIAESHDGVLVDRAEEPLAASPRSPHRGSALSRLNPKEYVDIKERMDVPPMEWKYQDIGTLTQQDAIGQFLADPDLAASHQMAGRSPAHPSLSVFETTRLGGGNRPVPVGHWSPHRVVQSFSPSHAGAHRECSNTDVADQDQASNHETGSSGAGLAEEIDFLQAQVKALKLENPATFCWLNSMLLSYMWTILRLRNFTMSMWGQLQHWIRTLLVQSLQHNILGLGTMPRCDCCSMSG